MEISFKIKQIDMDNEHEVNSLLNRLYSEYPHHDIFEAEEPIEIKQHTHDDYECRLFLTGNAEFNINGTVIECVKGSFIQIESKVPHSFKYSGEEPLKVIRFFSNENSWKANYC